MTQTKKYFDTVPVVQILNLLQDPYFNWIRENEGFIKGRYLWHPGEM